MYTKDVWKNCEGEREMKQYNCPDCERTDSCDGCPRLLRRPSNAEHLEHFIGITAPSYSYEGFTNEACARCSNNPKNGGSGICHCILGSRIFY